MRQNNKVLEGAYPVLAWEPADLNSSGATGDYINIAKYERVLFVAQLGDGTAGNDVDFTVKQAKDASGTDVKDCDCLITGRIYSQLAADYATQAALTEWTEETQATADAKWSDATNGEKVGLVCLEIHAEDLDVDNDFDWIRVDASDPSASKVVGGVYYCVGPRYSSAPELMLNPRS